MVKSNGKDEKSFWLREHGVLNPRPQNVVDELFLKDEFFFDPRDLVQVKYEMLRRVQRQGQNVTLAAAAFGFSRPSFYKARVALAESGLTGLLPRRRGPRQAHKLKDEVVDFIEQVKAERETLRTKELIELVRNRFGLSLHPRSIERALARRRQKKLQGRKP